MLTGIDAFYVIGKASFRQHLMYRWAHLGSTAGSALFGFIFTALWQAASRGRAVGSYGPDQLTAYVALTQSLLWLTTFLPRDLGISESVQSGRIATDFARPVEYLPQVFVSALGSVAYNFLFRSLPLATVFSLAGTLPWRAFAAGSRDLAFVASLAVGVVTGVFLQYLIGLTAFWTIDTRWARRLYFGVTMFAEGQLMPIQLMPPQLSRLLTWLPFQSLTALPVSVLLSRAKPAQWPAALLWTAGLAAAALWATRLARRRVQVHGG